jgi:hypothetical protein
MTGAFNESDALAITMLVVLALSFGCVLLIVVMVFRRGKADECEVEKLIKEVAEEDRKPEKAGPVDESASRQPWEREEDWWKG